MDFTELLKMGAGMIQGNSDEATTELDSESITSALGYLLGSDGEGLDLSTLMTGLSENGLGAIVGSWLGSGENESISADAISSLLGSDKVSAFASSLGLSEESAKNALAEVLPSMVDKATSGGNSIVDDMLAHVGGAEGAMSMLSKMFR